MPLRITIDLFSGRPNPSVVVTGLEEREILTRLASGRALERSRARASAAAAAPPAATLGYRGLIVEHLAEQGARTQRGGGRSLAVRAAAPPPLRVARGFAYQDGKAWPVLDPAIEEFVCSPAGPFRAAGLDARFFAHGARALARARATIVRSAVRSRAAVADACVCAPLWEPGWWNDGGPIQANNNCYNYATDYRTDTYAQPGRANAAMYATIDAVAVRTAALADALLDGPGKNRCPRKGHLVAMFVSAWDYHWYRKQRDGNWTHKPGPDPVTDLDNAGSVISDPRTADRGDYTLFGGFFIVQHGHVKIR